jgi:TnpA family transposase
MPVDFLTVDQQRSYGRFSDEPSRAQLAQYFHLDDRDRGFIDQLRGDHTRLGFAVQLATVRFLGTFLTDPRDVPTAAVAYLADQLGIAEPSCLDRYLDRSATHREHTAEIRRGYGYRDFGEQPEHFCLVRWLYARAWLSSERPSVLFDLATARLVERKILLPGATTLERLVASVRDRAIERLWQRLAATPSEEQRAKLDQLLVVPAGARVSALERLRRAPTRATAPALVEALGRLAEIRALGVGDLDLSSIPAGHVRTLARYAATTWAPVIARMPAARRTATLVAFARMFEATAQDDALDVLDLMIGALLTRVENEGDQARLRTIRDLDAAALRLRDACRIALDPRYPDLELREAIFTAVGGEHNLEVAVTAVSDLTRPPEDHYYEDLLSRYGQMRQFLPTLLRTVDFDGTAAGRPVLEALALLRQIEGQRKPDLSDSPRGVISRGWRSLVIDADGRIDRHGYTFCVLDRLRDVLRRHDVFVTPSERWADSRSKLLQGAAWEAARPNVCRALGRSSDPDVELDALGRQLDVAYRTMAANLPTNAAVRIERTSGRDRLVLTPLARLEEPPSLLALRVQVAQLLPRFDLPEALLEIHARTGFADEFIHISDNAARVADLPISLCAVLIAEACNIDLEALARREIPALTRGRLLWVQQNYVRAETITRANARLVAAQARISLARMWGGGEVATADGLRFVVPVRTINAAPNPKYFGRAHGATFFNFANDQFAGQGGVVVPGTPKDAPYLLAGLLEQWSGPPPTEIITDSGSYTDQLFGSFWLIGYRFSPRLADLGDAWLWRLDRTADYGVLNGLARNRIDRDLIAHNWDDLLRLAGSLKMSTIGAVELLHSLHGGGGVPTLGRALTELGRGPKTLHLLSYFDDEEQRRYIGRHLTRHESRHKLARHVFHGRRGQLRQAYREGMEDQLGALGLVVNVLVLWTTLYMDRALAQLRGHGAVVNDDDVARLSPLGTNHINVLGRYHFSLPVAIARGDFRPLRDPAEFDDEDSLIYATATEDL